MNRTYLAITIALGILVLLGGVVFYFTEINPSLPAQPALPKATDSSSPFSTFSSDFKTAPDAGSASSSVQADSSSSVSGDMPEQNVGEAVILSRSDEGVVPTTGAVVFLKDKKAGTEAARYVERGNGNIYEADLATRKIARLSIATIPKIIQSLWVPGGQGVYMQFLKDGTQSISTLYADLSQLGTTTAATSTAHVSADSAHPSALLEDILGIATQGKNAIFLGRNPSGAFAIETDLPGKKKGVTVWRSPLAEWNISWPKADIAALSTKASASAPGFLYFLNPATKRQAIILQDLLGLSTLLNSDATRVLYSDIGSSGLETKILTVATGKIEIVPVKTLADKCVWSAKEAETAYCAVPSDISGEIPDAWYRGTLSFSDQVWKIDMKTGAANIVLDADPKKPFDAQSLILSPNEDYLLFTNKNDLVLWSLRLK